MPTMPKKKFICKTAKLACSMLAKLVLCQVAKFAKLARNKLIKHVLCHSAKK